MADGHGKHMSQAMCQVQFTGKRITRDTVQANLNLVKTTISHLGTRVGIPTLEVHIQSFFDFMNMDPNVTRPQMQTYGKVFAFC